MVLLYIIIMLCCEEYLFICCTVIIDSFKTQWNKEVVLALELSLNNDAYGQRDLNNCVTLHNIVRNS